MRQRSYSGLFVAEGSSDAPLAELIESLFLERGIEVRLSQPDFSLLGKVDKDVRSRVAAGLRLVGAPVDLIVVHRDADNAGRSARLREITSAIDSLHLDSLLIPVIPVRMTEAWLLLDEATIRLVAGNPMGRMNLALPKRHEVEALADPKGFSRPASWPLRERPAAAGRRSVSDSANIGVNYFSYSIHRGRSLGSIAGSGYLKTSTR